MASQVLSGVSNPSYTNNTGQNVRLILSFTDGVTSVSWAGVTANFSSLKLDYPILNWNGSQLVESYSPRQTTPITKADPPYQLVLAPGQSFSAVCGPYNIIVIKEDGT